MASIASANAIATNASDAHDTSVNGSADVFQVRKVSIFDLMSVYRGHLRQIIRDHAINVKHKGRFERFWSNIFARWYLQSVRRRLVPIEALIDMRDLTSPAAEFQFRTTGLEAKIREKFKLFRQCVRSITPALINYSNFPGSAKAYFSTRQLELLEQRSALNTNKTQWARNTLAELLKFLGGQNNHLSVPPEAFGDMVITEAFGTSVNTRFPNPYCSALELDQLCFGSQGNFFNFTPKSGAWTMVNGPFGARVLKEAMERLVYQLVRIPDLHVIVILPVWDPETQRKYPKKLVDKKCRFEALDVLRETIFLKEDVVLMPDEHVFYNYFTAKQYSVCASHCIYLSNSTKTRRGSFDDFVNRWKAVKSTAVASSSESKI